MDGLLGARSDSGRFAMQHDREHVRNKQSIWQIVEQLLKYIRATESTDCSKYECVRQSLA